MANLFDQYEQAATKGTYRRPYEHMPEPVSTGFINASLEDDIPIFNKQRVNYSPRDTITHLVACNNFLVMGMTSNILTRIDLEHPDTQDEVELPKSVDDCIYKIHLDPTGRHLIVAMLSCENYYLSRNSKRPKPIGKLKGHQISAVGWNHQNTSENGTGEILLGSSKGLILETDINNAEDSKFFQASLEQYVKQLFNLGKDKSVPVTGIEFEKIPSNAMSEYKYFVMVTTPGRLYQFVGTMPSTTEPPIFQHIFSNYIDSPERFLELPGNFGHSELKFYHPKYRGLPKSFAWMTGPGIYFGHIDVSGKAGQDTVTMDTKLIPYPRDDDDKNINPISIVVTEFHVLTLFPNRFKAVCTLNDQTVYDDAGAERFGRLINMCKDPIKGTIWVFSGQAVFKYKVVRESRDVWQMYLSRGEFDLAKQYCVDNPAHTDKVLTKQAEHLFSQARYIDSAELYAQTQNSFEEITLKFIELDQKEALKSFLLRRLVVLKPQDKTQVTMLITWLVEIYLNQLGQYKEEGAEMSHKYEALQEEFRKFLAHAKVKDCVEENKNIVYDLIASHGDVENMIFFAVLTQDYERVITHHLQHDNHRNALAVLTKHQDTALFYKFSPVLMENAPAETVSAWMAMKDRLDPKRLIPALVQYNHDRHRAQDHEAIRYLEFCVQVLGVKDQAIHNYLVALYAQLQPEQLLKYLNIQGTEADEVFYDLKYALRVCSEHDHQRACVHIYSTMGLYEEAVDLALQVDVDSAKQNADKPEDDEELRKKLWLKIARHVVEKEKDIQRAMEFLQECDLLKIEDILPFFPDFVTIDHFKDAICTSLQEYNQHIESLKEDMKEATSSASDIRGEIQSFRNKYTFVKSQDKCSCCGFPLMTRSFYVFPCMHRFHSDCLTAEMLPHLTTSKRIRVDEIQRKLVSKESPGSQGRSLSRSLSTGPDAILKEELDELIAAECIYCGDVMIRGVDRPFIDEEEFDSVMSSWL